MTDEWQNNPFYQINTYLDWVKTEGVPIVEAYAVDCLTQPLEPSARLGGLGAYIHLAGRGDNATCYLAEIPAGGSLKPEKHLHDKLVYVLAGRGATSVEAPDGRKHSLSGDPGVSSASRSTPATSTTTALAASPRAWHPSPTCRSS
jgi:hypothetical protein